MKSIFTFDEMGEVKPECVPLIGTTEYAVSRNFFLFKVCHTNRHMIEMYADYINRYFDNAFIKLGIEIIEYEYPDKYEHYSDEMIDYINSTYCLDSDYGDTALWVSSYLDTKSYRNYILGNIDIMTSDTLLWYIDESGLDSSIFASEEILSQIFIISKYVRDKSIRDLLILFIKYSIRIVKCENDSVFAGKNKYIDSVYYPLYALQRFVMSVKEDW